MGVGGERSSEARRVVFLLDQVRRVRLEPVLDVELRVEILRTEGHQWGS